MKIFSQKLEDNLKTYILVIGLGLAAGIITELLNLFPYDTLWSFSSIASAFGFWIFTTTLMIDFSCSNKNAAINVFLYLSSMNFSFYFFQYMLGLFFLKFYVEEFFWGLLLRFDIFALLCAAVSYVLYYWNRNNKISNILYALPISGLGAETIGVALFLYNTHTYLGQLVFDFLSFLFLIWFFNKKVNNKPIFFTTIVAASLFGYYLFYLPHI